MNNPLSTANCIRNGYYTVDGVVYAENGAPAKKMNHIIKWYQVNMSYEDKYRFNLLTYPEYLAWMEELANNAVASSSDDGRTFWENDTTERANISGVDYQEFLAKNNIDISNDTTINMEELLKEVSENSPTEATPEQMVNSSVCYSPNGMVEEAPATEDASMDEILANVNKDIHGGDAILTQEEIAALFAAAEQGNL